jgi:hypothetical protein
VHPLQLLSPATPQSGRHHYLPQCFTVDPDPVPLGQILTGQARAESLIHLLGEDARRLLAGLLAQPPIGPSTSLAVNHREIAGFLQLCQQPSHLSLGKIQLLGSLLAGSASSVLS